MCPGADVLGRRIVSPGSSVTFALALLAPSICDVDDPRDRDYKQKKFEDPRAAIGCPTKQPFEKVHGLFSLLKANVDQNANSAPAFKAKGCTRVVDWALGTKRPAYSRRRSV